MISQHVRDEIFSFLVEDLNTFINTVDDVFYTSSPSRRQAALDQLTEKQPLSIKLCTKLFANGRYTEVSMRLYRLAKAFGKPKLLIAQSASALPADIRKDFVKAAITSYPGAIVQWADNQVPAERIFKVAKLTGIPIEQLRPDLFRDSCP